MQKAIGVFAATALVTALFVGKGLAIPLTSGNSGGQVGVDPQNHLHLAQQCYKRVGPFATQTTAWQRWREAQAQGQAQGYAVSNGVVPCYDQGTRGYCFNVFYSC
jgi:streptogramin lyase